MTFVHSHVNAKKAEHELLVLFTEISIVNRYDLFFNLTQETQILPGVEERKRVI